MKKFLFVFLIISFVFGCSFKGKNKIEREKLAIQAVIEGEIKASFEGDYDTWVTFFAHEPYTFWLQASQSGYINFKGWEELNSQAKLSVNPENEQNATHVGNFDYSFKIYKESAFVTFSIKMIVIEDNINVERIGIEVRGLEKKKGKWKITYLGTVYSSSYPDQH